MVKANMTLVVNSKALADARMYAGQIDEEFTSLIEAFHVGGIRATGIELKVNGLKHALDTMEVEKKEIPPPVIKEEETPEKKPPIVTVPKKTSSRKRKVY